MQKSLVGLATALGMLLAAPAPADACSIKLIGANHAPRRAVARRAVIRNDTRIAKDALVPRTPKDAGGGTTSLGHPKASGGGTAGTTTGTTTGTGTGTTTGTTASLSTGTATGGETRIRTQQVVQAPGTLHEQIYFGLGSTNVGRKSTIAKAVKWLGANASSTIVIEGHADPSGSPEANMVLSQHRADAVKDAIVAEGVDAARIEVQAFGDTKLQYGRTDGRNRRVTIKAKP
jgi:peptidoglycan-associated lipoprotein